MKFAIPVVFFLSVSAAAQPALTRIERQRTQQMLTSIKNEIRKNYFDPAFRGMDIDKHFEAANAKLEQATSLGQAMGIIAQALLDFDDSHTFFFPPSRTNRAEYGWEMRMVGDDCYVVAVRPGSDADKKGLKPGTRVLAVEGRKPTRQTLWKIWYQFYTLSPRPGLRLAVQAPGQPPQELDIAAKTTQAKRTLDLTGVDSSMDFDELIREAEREERVSRHRYVRVGSTAIWKMPGFDDPDGVDRFANDVFKGADSLILDLRGNSGGYVVTLERFAARFFDREVKIADLKGRKSMKPIVAKKHNRPFTGKVVALVDSRSASAAELLARLFQIEKRGIVIGDQSSGSVMQSYGYAGQMGAERLVFFGASVTNADVIMTDGKSLERTGVTPDERLLPTAEDMATGRDPVMVRAAEILGLTLDAKAAGAMFPVEWR